MFELTAKPLLEPMFDGQATVLTSRQQIVLAGWFVKTGLVISLCAGRVERHSDEIVDGLRRDLHEMLG